MGALKPRLTTEGAGSEGGEDLLFADFVVYRRQRCQIWRRLPHPPQNPRTPRKRAVLTKIASALVSRATKNLDGRPQR